MANPGEALAATIDAQWNVGTGGTKPSDIEYIVNTSDFEPNPLATDAIFVFLPLRGTKERFNSKLRNATYFPRVVCQTKTDTARLEQITNEVDRIVAAGTPITGATYQDVLEVNDISDRMRGGYPFWVSEIQCKIFTQFESSATQYGTATTSLLTTDELTVNNDADIGGDLTVSGYDFKEVNMLGAANAAWVSMVYEGDGQVTIKNRLLTGRVSNVDGINTILSYVLSGVPLVKGSLKLYVDGVRVDIFLANGTNYVTNTFMGIWNNDGNTGIIDDATDLNARNSYPFTDTAVDVSAGKAIKALLTTVVADAGALRIVNVSARCYYDA